MRVEQAPRIAGHPALDLVNTVDPQGRPRGPAIDYLSSYGDLVRWSRATGLLDEKKERALVALADENPARAGREFKRTLELRDLIYRVFAAIARHESPTAADLTELGSLAAQARSTQTLARDHGTFTWHWKEPVSFDLPTLALADSASELLTRHEQLRTRIRMCEGSPCGWLFVDTSKGGRRRWCAMSMCGNRAKARRLVKH